MTCNIIEDLLPLYADNICSDDSRDLIEQHIAQCEDCRKKLEAMTEQHDIPKKKGEAKMPFKKVKKHYLRIIIVTLIICVIAIIPSVTAIVLTVNDQCGTGRGWAVIAFEKRMTETVSYLKNGEYRQFLDHVDIVNQHEYSQEELSGFKDIFADEFKRFFEKYPIKKIKVIGRTGTPNDCTEGIVQAELETEYSDRQKAVYFYFYLGELYENSNDLYIDGFDIKCMSRDIPFIKDTQYDIPLDGNILSDMKIQLPILDFPDIGFTEEYFGHLKNAQKFEEVSSMSLFFYKEGKYENFKEFSDTMNADIQDLASAYDYIGCEVGALTYEPSDIINKGDMLYFRKVKLTFSDKDGEEFSVSFSMPIDPTGYPETITYFQDISYSDNAPDEFRTLFEKAFTLQK